LPHGWLLRLRGASRAGTGVQRTLQGRLIKTNQAASGTQVRRWAAPGVPQRSTKRSPSCTVGSPSIPAARALPGLRIPPAAEEDADKPRVDVLHVGPGPGASRVRAATIFPNICVAADVTLYIFFPLSLW